MVTFLLAMHGCMKVNLKGNAVIYTSWQYAPYKAEISHDTCLTILFLLFMTNNMYRYLINIQHTTSYVLHLNECL